MKYVLIATINIIYGILLFLTLSFSTPGYFIVFTVALVLTLLGIVGFVLWIKSLKEKSKITPLPISPPIQTEGNQQIQNPTVQSQDLKKSTKDEPLTEWFNLALSFDILLIIGLFFRALVIQPFIVEGSSMEPNFHDREAILVDKISYRFKNPARGEVIIFKSPSQPEEDYIKRIIGIPGDTISVKKGKVYVNSKELVENYLASGTYTSNESSLTTTNNSITLKTNQYFVMGDNRSHSSDSREWGTVPTVNIVGKAAVAVYPVQDFRLIKTPDIRFLDVTYQSKNFINYLAKYF